MVGVPSSSGCTTCRKRKIKCDEASPICGQCRRSHRQCSGPVIPRKFVDETAKQRSKGGNESSEYFHTLPANSMWFSQDRRGSNGALFQKWHRSATCNPVLTMPASPSLSPNQTLAMRLISSYTQDQTGLSLRVLARHTRDLPPRIGTSEALDDAVVCLLATVDSANQRECPGAWIKRSLYGRSLRSLRKALNDPVEGFSSNTLAATAVLYLIEAHSGNIKDWNHIHHAGGVARLIEARGPELHTDEFEWRLALNFLGPMVSRAVVLGLPCFFSSPAWTRLFASCRGCTDTKTLLQSSLSLMAYWPGLAQDIRTLRIDSVSVDIPSLLQRIHKVKASLNTTIGCKLQSMLDSGETPTVRTSTERDAALVPTAYAFEDFEIANFYCYHARYILALNRMLVAVCAAAETFGHQNYGILSAPAMRQALQAENHVLSTRIWMTWPFASRYLPFGAHFIMVPLYMSFEHAPTRAMRQWILDCLNEIYGCRQPEDGPVRLTEERLLHLVRTLTGEADLAAHFIVKEGA